MEPQDALEATKDDLANAAELVGESAEDTREAVEMIIQRYEAYRNGDEEEVDISIERI